ncbi:MAG: thioredoxin [Syntrophales bacterium]|jgi:thioredoxin 1
MGSGDFVKKVEDAGFEEDIIKADKPALVDFWAPWCGPCRAISPLVEEIAETYQGRVIVGKVNVDENPRISETYGIRSIPALMLFKDGKLFDTLIGLVPKERLEAFIKKAL